MQFASIQPQTRSWQWLAVAAFALSATVFMWVARGLFQDDAFIHLRIARSLMDFGFYSFNGDRPAYCTSSPLFTALLGLCSQLVSSPFLPKIIDVLIYWVLFLMVARLVISASNARSQWLSLAFLAAVASPLAMRWLTDGMETGLVGVAALLFAGIASEVCSPIQPPSAAKLLGAMLLGALATTLRVEFSFLAAVVGAASLTQLQRTRKLNPLAVSLAVGSALGLLLIWRVFGTVLPDTAVAKAAAVSGLPSSANVIETLVNMAKAHAAASSLGILVMLAWGVSVTMALRNASHRSFVLALNCAFVLFVALILWRQQVIQGYRYFVFMEFFLLGFNILALKSEGRPPSSLNNVPASCRTPPILIVLLCLVFAGWQVYDLHKLRTISDGRSASFEKFEHADLRDLAGKYGMAWDVGLVGYFSHATILDGNGLVNGREIARQSKPERLRTYVKDHPIQFIFANVGQLKELDGLIDVSGWTMRGTFDFPNYSGQPDRHFLLVKNR